MTLTSQPSASVTFGLSSSDTTEGNLLTTSLTFNSSNWNVPQSIFVSGINDSTPDGNIAYSIVTGAFSSSDSNFNGVDPGDIAMTNIDDDSYTITVARTSGLVTSEDGGTDSFTITLGAAPSADVTINLSSSDPTEGVPSPSSVTFTPTGAKIASVIVAGLDDAQIDGQQSYSIITAPAVSSDPNYSGKNGADVSVINTDNDQIDQAVVPPGGKFGASVATADVNCDSIPDLIVGSRDIGYGIVRIYYGSSSGYSSTADLSISDSTYNADFGIRVAGLGDINHDGCEDIAVSATVGVGTVYVFYGSASGMATQSSAADWKVSGDISGDFFGDALAAGDFNGDGYVDLAIGASRYTVDQTFEGRVFVFLNSSGTLPGVSGVATLSDSAWMFESDVVSGYTAIGDGLAVANVNGDAYSDLIIGVSNYTNGQSGEGAVYAFYGSSTGFNDALADKMAHPSDADWSAESDFASAKFGSAVANAGRINGDAYDDIIVGAPNYTNGQSNEGAAFVFFGSATGLVAAAAGDGIVRATTESDWQFESNSAGAYLGTQVNAAGDINNDGFGDVIVAAPTYTSSSRQMIFLGSATGIASSPMVSLGPSQGNSGVGTVGDLNGDGYSDIYIAEDVYRPFSYYGTVDVFLSNISSPGFIVSPTSGLTTTESGGQATFNVALANAPSASVTINLSSTNTAEGTVSPASLVFDQANWNQPQMVTVTGVNDAVTDGAVSYTIQLAPAVSGDSSYNGLDPADVSVSNLDNDVPQQVTVTGINAPSESLSGSVTFTRLGEITADLTVAYSVGGTAVAGSDYTGLSGTAVIPTGSSSVTVPIDPIDNYVATGNKTVIVNVSDTVDYTAAAPGSATVTITEDDVLGITVFPAIGLITTEAGGTASFSIVLGSEPSADVTVNLSSSDTSEGQVIPSSVTFTPGNWNAAQNVTVVGVDDAAIDGDVAYSITTSAAVSGDPQYSGLAVTDVAAVNRDDDSLSKVQVIATKARVTEGTTPGIFTVTRSGSTTADLRVFYSVTGSATRAVDYYSLPGMVTIAAGSSSATVDVGTIQDNTLEPDETVILSLAPATGYILDKPSASTVVISDDDQPHVPMVNFALDQTLAEGATATVTAVLSEVASAYPVTIPYTVGGTATNPADHDAASGNIVINSGTVGTVTFNVVSDAVAEPAETVVFTMGTPVNATAGNKTTHTVTIQESNGSPNVSLQTVQNGTDARLIVTGDGQVTVTASVTDPNQGDTFSYDWSLSNAALVDTDGNPATFTFDPSALAPGFYAVRLTVTDNGSPPLSTTVEKLLQVVSSQPVLSNAVDSDNDGINDDVESYIDSDGDGVPDYLDNDTLAGNELQLMSSTTGYIMRTDPGLVLGLGNVAFAASADGALVSEADIAAYGGGEGNAGSASAQDTVPNTGGYVDFEITQLPVAGQSVQVVIPQLAPIPAGASYRKYDPVSGWRDFVTDAANAIASAHGAPGECPLPGDPAFTPGLTAGDYCIQLTLQDGGPNDTDGLVNHVVADPGKLGALANSAGDTSSAGGGSGGSVSTSGTSGGGAVDLTLLMAMLLMAMRNIRDKITRRSLGGYESGQTDAQTTNISPACVTSGEKLKG